jgi:hydrophobic/amphiphilic exporter-1 (mainly G- bacteria), HAE1 family
MGLERTIAQRVPSFSSRRCAYGNWVRWTIALSAKNGILIVEVAREHRNFDGKPILKAAVDAARIRFRPILMTSFAFILGVLPLVLATGAGANARKSLGISVFTGMIASTCLAVVFVSAFFVVLQQLDERRRRKPSVAPPKEVIPEPAAPAADH